MRPHSHTEREKCHHQGYRGRMGIYELLRVDESVRAMIRRRESETDILRHVRRNSPGIREDGLRRVRAGMTTMEEVMRVTQED